MAFNIHFSNMGRMFAAITAQYLKTPAISTLVKSGFINAGNTVQMPITETFSVNRGENADTKIKEIYDYTHDALSEVKLTTASAKTSKIVSSRLGTGLQRAYFNPAVVRELFQSASGQSQEIERVIGTLNMHYAAVCRGLDSFIIKSITDNNHVKTDNDGTSHEGTDTTFETDTGRTAYPSKLNLAVIDATTQHKIIEDIKAAAAVSFNGISLLDSYEVLYVILPMSVFGKVSAAFGYPGKWAMTNRSGEGDGTPVYTISNMLTVEGLVFVGVPDADISTTTANLKTVWRSLILPASSMVWNTSRIPISEGIVYNGQKVSTAMVVQAINQALEGGGITNSSMNFESLMAESARRDSDPMILAYNGAPATGIYYSAVFDFQDMPPATTPDSKATTFDASACIAGVRARPHFIQEYQIAQDLAPVTAVAGASTGGMSMAEPATTSKKA